VSWIGLAMLAVAGFLLGGVVSAWRRSRSLAVVLGIGTALAVASGVAWLLLIALDCAAPRGVQPRGGPYLRTAIGITGYRPS